jgi:O-antigen/teichoic acid export membrane protein
MLIWGATANGCAVVGLFGQLRVRPEFGRVRAWLVEHSDLWRYYVVENGLIQTGNVVVLAMIGGLASVASTGALRAATAAFAPLIIVGLGTMSAGTSELARLAARDRQLMHRAVGALTVLSGLVTAAYGGALLRAPGLGHALFGKTWHLAHPLVPFIIFDAIAQLAVTGPFAGLRALGLGAHSLRARWTLAVMRVVAAAIGTIIGGVRGAAIAFAVTSPLQIGVWVFVFARHARLSAQSIPEAQITA